jgi:hypothetical protein
MQICEFSFHIDGGACIQAMHAYISYKVLVQAGIKKHRNTKMAIKNTRL